VDFASKTENSVLTPRSPGRLANHHLKFDAGHPQQSILSTTGDATETRVSMVMHNKPAKLMFIVPENLTADDYTIR
jgi:hypothetical protein